MPTIIALDTSLSMQRTIPGRSEENALTFHQLAVKGISQFLEHLSGNFRLEFVSLVTYSSGCETKIDFTREYDLIRQALKKIEPRDKSCFENALKFINNSLSTQWGTQNYCQVVIFTDCGLGFGTTSMQNLIQNIIAKKNECEYKWLSVLKPTKLNFICMGLHSDYFFTKSTKLYQQLLDYSGLKGQLFLPKTKETTDVESESGSKYTSHKSELGRTTMSELIERLCEANFKPFETSLKCGAYFRLECPILLWPQPRPVLRNNVYLEEKTLTVSQKIETCGFLSLSEIGSPATISRHIIIPKIEREKPSRRSSEKSSKNSASVVANQKILSEALSSANTEFEKFENEVRAFYARADTDEEDWTKSTNANDTNRDSLCVLLHAALKVENMAALVLLNEDWYGFIHSFSDNKKKSNLILNILAPGSNVIPWLGDFNMLGMVDDFFPGESTSFPVKSEKRSYSQSCVIWIKHSSLQSDIQKVLRHAKKIPEKTQHFYKELNRIRRAALSIGFIELLEALALILEKEAGNLPSNANPECAPQLKHAARELRKTTNRDLKIAINPLPKNFSGDIMYID